METGQTAAVAAQGALWSGDVDGARESTSSDEDDVLLFDSLPEKPAPLSATHPFQQLRHKVTRLGLKKWQEYIAPSGPRPSRGPVSGSLRHQTFQSLINALSLRPHKRARVQGWNAHDEAALGHTQSGFNDDDGQESYTGESSASGPDIVRVERRQLLACPFYRLDATRYAACLHGVELTSARAVAQHVIVDHRAPAYCPDCYLTFPTAAARDAHIVARTCEQKDGPEDDAALQGISEEQVEALAAAVSSRVRVVRAKKGVKKGPHRLRRGKQHATRKPTEIEKWQRILAIVSSRNRPNTTTGAIQCMSEALRRPLSPYLVSPEEQQALRLRRFWLAKGQAIVASVVREQDPSAWDDGKFGDEAALESLHWAVLDDLMQAWFSFVRGGEQQQLQDGGQQHAAEQDV